MVIISCFRFRLEIPFLGKLGPKKIKIVSFYFLFYFSTIFLQYENTQKVKNIYIYIYIHIYIYIYTHTYIKIQVQYYSRCKEPAEGGLECLFTRYL